MKVHEVMTSRPRTVSPDNSLSEAAGLMRELDVGVLPVWENGRLAGIVTDRDIVVRGIADGRDPNTSLVSEVMSGGIECVAADQEVEEAVRIMEQHQIRRLPVLDGGSELIGMISLGDIATSSNPAFSGIVLRDVSQPAHPTARQRRLAQYSESAQMPQVPGTARRAPSRADSAQAPRKRARRSGTKTRAGTTKRSGRARTKNEVRTSSTRGRRKAGQAGRRSTQKSRR